jgi:hypothetical protein
MSHDHKKSKHVFKRQAHKRAARRNEKKSLRSDYDVFPTGKIPFRFEVRPRYE